MTLTHNFVYGITLLLLAVSAWPQSRNDGGSLLEIDCDTQLNCTLIEPVCGSDDVTYDSSCDLELENQKRYCVIGDFVKISMAHKGNCTNDEKQPLG